VVLEDDATGAWIHRKGNDWLARFPDMLSFYLGTGRPPQYQMQIAERLIVADKTRADFITLPRLIHGVCYSVPPQHISRVLSRWETASLPIMQWVMLMVAQWSIRVTRWWTMLTVNRLSVTLTQRHAQNAAGRGG
jgi:hypothetical protein